MNDFRATPLTWGENTRYPFFPTKSPIEELFATKIESGNDMLASWNEIMYMPVKVMCDSLGRP
jgi:hypothetical protein